MKKKAGGNKIEKNIKKNGKRGRTYGYIDATNNEYKINGKNIKIKGFK